MLSMTVMEILGREGFRNAIQLYVNDEDHFVERCRDELILPRMAFINRMFVQANDPEFLAHMVLYQLRKMAVNETATAMS